jgi:hypothetical protein
MSRAREASFVYCVSDDTGQAKEDLVREWSSSMRPRWVSDVVFPEQTPAPAVERRELSPEREYAVRLAHLVARRKALLSAIPPDHSKRLGLLKERITEHEQDLEDLERGRGRWTNTEVGEAARELDRAEWRLVEARHFGDWAGSRRERRSWSKEVEAQAGELQRAEDRKRDLTAAYREEAEARLEVLRLRAAELEAKVEARTR